MSRLLVIGCGGVAQVAIQKCCQNSGTFTELMIASRTESKCIALKEKLEAAGTPVKLSTAWVDADDVEELEALIRAYKPDAVLNVALPYQDLTIMDACLEAARRRASAPISITAGSGPTMRSSNRPALRRSSARALIRA